MGRRTGKRYKSAFYPKNCEIRVIDFGGATFKSDYHSEIINTRQYRAPEVILGDFYPDLGWDLSSDLWSVGCILVELHTGELLFPTHKDSEHLAMMRKVVGKFPSWMGRECTREFRQYFDRNYRLDYPYAFSDKVVRNVDHLPYLEVLYMQDLVRRKYDHFIHLLYDLLELDPSMRIKARQALKHAFFKATY